MSTPATMDNTEEYWDKYLVDCEKQGLRPDLSDFKVWLEENVPDGYLYEED